MAKHENGQDPLDTPVMRQYLEVKKQHPDTILFFRMGDFYEMFLDDAQIAAPILDVALTKRQNSVPMAGIPYHSVDTYIARLLSAGKKVAIAEQSPDPQNPKLMRRTVRRVITPGTVIEESLISSSFHNYLLAVLYGEEAHGIGVADVSTGDFFSTIAYGDDELRNIYHKYAPGEIITPSDSIEKLGMLLPEAKTKFVAVEGWKGSALEGERQIELCYGVSPSGLGYSKEEGAALASVAMILHYVRTSFPDQGVTLESPVFRPPETGFLTLDAETIRNLELVANQKDGGMERTLFHVLDYCRTPAGKRFLKDSLLHPLTGEEEILSRQRMVGQLVENNRLRQKARDLLGEMADLERILARFTSGRSAPRDFPAIAGTLEAAMELQKELSPFDFGDLCDALKSSKEIASLAETIRRVVVDEPPAVFGNAPFVREGVDERLDRSRDALKSGAEWILQFEEEERRRTGISTLKVKYNKVVGYFIEMSRNQAVDAPSDYLKKQTLVGNERFTCEKLDELERTIRTADGVIVDVEQEVLTSLREQALGSKHDLRRIARAIARADFFISLAECALHGNWSCPVLSEREILIQGGRHPVVERFLPVGERFVPNDLSMDDTRSFSILTGPNMAGKSTYIRQTALIQVLMQIGSYVPADRCHLPISDGVFTRIGASDNLTRGESTFYVEMVESARILNRCTDRSLVIMDEVGRGTSTYDGLSIAWAIVEYLTDAKKPKVLFATHYHELTALETIDGVFNLTMDVRDIDGHVTFLHRVREGSADQSYGIHVAKLAGLPQSVIKRAFEKLNELEGASPEREDRKKIEKKDAKATRREPGQQTLF